LILSPTSSLIEDVIIRNEKKELLRRDERFSDVKALVSSDIPFHFFIKLNDTDWLQLDPTFYKKEKENTSDLARFSGYCSVSDSSHHPFILTGSDMTTSIASTLPAKTSILDIYAYPDFETGWSRHDFFHTNTAASKFWSRAWQDLGDTCQCDLNEAMLSWRSGIWGSAVISLNDSATAEVSFFGMRDSIDVIPLMRSVLVEQSTRPDKIYTIKYPELFERNQQQSILVDANYITQVNDVVFVAATPNELMAVTNSAAKLDQETSFQLARNATNKNGGRFIYQSEYYTSVLPSIWINTLRGFPFVTTQVERVKDNKYLVSVDVPFKQNTSSASSPASPASETVNEDTGKIIHGPWTVINHNTKDKEQLIQNDKKEICLIGSDGKILWRKKFDSEIFGDVTQVDALKNGKLQMAFSTENGIHILDRNGEELKGFPILPKPPLTAPLHIADYENNKKYRLLYAAGDDWLNNQTIEGKATEGWKYNGAGMILWIDHFKVANEDVILTVSPLGNIQLLKRTGEVKTTTSAVLEKYNGGKIKIEPGATLEETKVTYTNKAGEEKSVPLGK